MRKVIFSILILVVSMGFLNAQQLRKVSNTAFKRGEKFEYRVCYDSYLTGKVTAGYATLEVTNENKKIANRNTLHIVGWGKSRKAFDWFFKVIDRYETYIDEESFAPWLFIRRVNEGGYIIHQDVYFNQFKRVAKTVKNGKDTTTRKTEPYIQDIISTFYYARTFDVSKMKINDTIKIDFFLDDSTYNTKIIFLGRETITTSIGKIKCMKFKPWVVTGAVFKDP